MKNEARKNDFKKLLIMSHVTLNLYHTDNVWGTLQRRWLRHYATSWNVAGSILNEVVGFFNCPNTTAL
jgi:hypothetical protein